MLFSMTALAHRIYCKIILEYIGKSLFSGYFHLPWTQALRKSVSCVFIFFNLHKSVFKTIAEFLIVPECARQGYKGLISYDCSAS